MEVKEYMLDVTHMCNLNCAFCLCGEPLPISISESVIKSAFIGIDKIDNLYLSGGEPLLDLNLIYLIKKIIKKNKISINTLTVTTNGTYLDNKRKDALLYLYSKIPNPKLEMSVDRFHRMAVEEYIMQIGAKGSLSFENFVYNAENFCYKNGIEFVKKDVLEDNVVAKMGRAKNMPDAIPCDNSFNALGNYSMLTHSYDDMVTITPTGKVVRCNYENNNIDDISIGTVLSDSLETLIYRKCIEEIKQNSEINFLDFNTISSEIEREYQIKKASIK